MSGGSRYDLSVVISTHARPRELREAIAAIRAQTYPGPIETVVVWDRAEVDHELAVDPGADPHRPVRVLANDRTPGLPGSRNCGAAAASAPVLGFCDDDDLWLPDRAERQLALLEASGSDVVSGGQEVEVEDRVVTRRGCEGVLRFQDLLRSRRIEANMVTTIVRAEAFWGSIGPLDEHIPGGFAEDYEWMLRAARHVPVPVVPEPVARIRWTVRSHFRDQWPVWEAALPVVLERNPEFAAEPEGRARIEGQIAVAVAAQGRRREALDRARRTLAWSWREPRALIAIAVALGAPIEPIAAALNRRGRGI